MPEVKEGALREGEGAWETAAPPSAEACILPLKMHDIVKPNNGFQGSTFILSLLKRKQKLKRSHVLQPISTKENI